MITIHSSTATEYSSNGLAVLDPISCVLSVAVNGAWVLEMEYPLDEDKKFEKIKKDNVIKIDNIPIIAEQTSSYQLFRIYDTVETLTTVKAIAFPVAFEATYDAIIEELKTEKKTATATLQDISAYLTAHGVTKYTITSDYTHSGATPRQKKGNFEDTNLIEAISGSGDNSIINHWGGEVAYDNYKIIVNDKLGTDSDYDVRYGKNMTGLSVDTDMSGVVTRLYPKSSDGVRLSYTPSGASQAQSYVDSALITPPNVNPYPYIRSAFIQTDYKLVDTSFKVNQVNSATAIATHSAQEAMTTAIRTVAADMWSNLTQGEQWNSKWYEPEWVQSVLDDVVKTLQAELMTTWSITHPTLKQLVQTCLKEGISWIKKEDIEDFYWELVTGSADVYCYTNGSRQIEGQYYYADKRYCWFNSAGNYLPEKDIESFDWIQGKTSNAKKKYGDNQRYYAKGTYVYTMGDDGSGGTQFNQYYFDSDGWWDGTSNEASEWDWHQDGSKWWFGASDAGDNENKYAHDCWLYIKASASSTPKLYYFDSDGYSVSDLETECNWDWHEKENKWYFGSLTKSQFAVYVTNQWLKVDGSWRKFDSNGYQIKMDTLKTQLTNLLKNALNTSCASVINYQKNYLYTTLYEQMVDYCQERYELDEIDKPKVTIKANVVELSKMEGYEDISQFETAHLGDDVQIHDYEHNIHETERVVALKYDCIQGYNTEITIDKLGYNVAQLAKIQGSSIKSDKTETLVAGEGITINNGVIGIDFTPGDAFQGDQVVVDPIVTGGTKIADIYVNGTAHPIYSDGGSDVEVVQYLESGTHIADIVIDNTTYALYSDGLQWWVETETDFYRTGTHEETEYDEDFFFDTVETWRNLSPSHAYYGDYDFTRANNYDAIIGNYSNGTNSYFVLASKVEHGADWLWRDANRIQPADYVAPTSGDGRYVWKGEINYWGETWYASVGQYNFEAGDVTTTPFISFTLTGEENVPQDYVRSLLRTAIETEEVADVVGLSNQNTVFYFGTGTPSNHENVAWITKDGVFHGKGFEVDGEPVGGLSKTQLYAGTQYAQTINLSESYNGFSFILIETYNSNDKKNLSSLLSVSDLVSGSYVGIDKYLLYTITNTKKLTFHDDFDDTNHSRYIKKIYGLRSGDDEGGGSDNAVLDVTVNGNSVVSDRVASIDLTGKQDTLIAGTNISIGQDGKTISATDTDEISELDDVSLSNLANGQILKYNSTSQKWENANESGGTTVIANPSGTASADLEKIQVGSTIYGIPSTEVVANPSGTPTNDLNTIEIGSTIYNVAGGGGSTVETNMIAQPLTTYIHDGETVVRNGERTEMYFSSPVSASDPRGIVAWTNAISSGVKRIKYTFDVTAHHSPASPTYPDEYANIIIGIKSTYQTPVNVSVTDSDWIGLKRFNTIGTHEGEFEISTTQDFYLYILANSWDMDITELKTVEYIGGGASELTDLSDTDIATPSNGEVLTYNATSQKWENSTPSGGARELTQSQYDALSQAEKTNGTIYFVKSDTNYVYHTNQDGTLVVRIDPTLNQTLWFFCGYTKTASDIAPPSELSQYAPSNLLQTSNYPNKGTTQDGWVGFYLGNIRTWTQDTSQVMGGTFWGVLDVAGALQQITPYFDPYDVSTKIYFMGTEYASKN